MDDIRNDQPISNIDSEYQVLGIAWRWPDNLDTIIDILPSSEYFFIPKNRAIYEFLLKLYLDNKPIDISLYSQDIFAQDKFKLTECIEILESVVTPDNIKHHCHNLIEAQKLRLLQKTYDQVHKEMARPDGDTLDTIIGITQKNLDIITEQTGEYLYTYADILPDTIENIAKINEGEIEPGLETHIPDLNQHYRFKAPQLTILAGRPGQGKSALGLNFAEYIAIDRDEPVVIFSAEMSGQELQQRTLFSRAHVDAEKLNNQKFTAYEWEKIIQSSQILGASATNFIICDAPVITPAKIRSVIKALIKKLGRNPALIIIDYLQLLHPDFRMANREQDIASITRALKQIAKEFGIPVLCLAQLNREVEKRSKGNKRPMLSDLRESGAIEQDADVVLGIYHSQEDKDKLGDIRQAEICILKNRGGTCKNIDVVWHPVFTRFSGIDWQHNQADQEIEGGYDETQFTF